MSVKIKKTHQMKYEYNGNVYETLEELRKEEEKKIHNKIYDYVCDEWAKEYNKADISLYMIDVNGYREKRFKELLIKDYEKIRHLFFEIEQEKENLANALRLFAWEDSYFPDRFVWVGEVDYVS